MDEIRALYDIWKKTFFGSLFHLVDKNGKITCTFFVFFFGLGLWHFFGKFFDPIDRFIIVRYGKITCIVCGPKALYTNLFFLFASSSWCRMLWKRKITSILLIFLSKTVFDVKSLVSQYEEFFKKIIRVQKCFILSKIYKKLAFVTICQFLSIF